MKILITILFAVSFTLSLHAQGDAHYQAAADFFDNKQFEKALKEVNEALKKDSQNIDAHILKGNTLEALHKPQEALNAYTKTIDLFPGNYLGWNFRAILLTNTGHPEDALADYNEALSFEKKDSNRLLLYVNRATAEITMRQFEEAYEDCISAYKIDSLSIGALNNLATVCDEVGKGDQTIGYLNKILTIDSTFIGAWGNLGFKYQEMGEYKKAITYFDKVAELDPMEPLAFSNRSYNKYKLGDLPGAMKDITISITLYPANSYAYRIRALIYFAQDKKEKACADLMTAIDKGFTKMYGDEVKDLQKKNCY